MNDFLHLTPLPVAAAAPVRTAKKTRRRRGLHLRKAASQFDFKIAVKMALLREGLTVTALASQLGVSRVAVSHAINHGIHRPTRERIAQRLRIAA